MAIPVAVGDVIKMRVYTYNTVRSQLGINVFYYLIGGVTGGPGSLQDLAGGLDLLVGPQYVNWLPDNCNYSGIRVERVDPAPTPSVIAVGSAAPGAGSSAVSPAAACGILRRSTDIRGPGGRGRIFAPFVDHGNLTVGGDLSVAGQTLLDLISQVTLASNTGFILPVIGTVIPATYSLICGLYAATNPVPFRPLTGFKVESKIGTQHRRGDYGKQNVEGP